MDTNEAWERFRGTSSIYKTSSAEKLDTLAAAVNNLQTTVSRLATAIPSAQGDAAAIDAANASAPPMMPPGMGGAMGMDPGMGGGDMGMGMDMPVPMGGEDEYGDEGYGDLDMTKDEEMPEMGAEEEGVPSEDDEGVPFGEDVPEEGAPAEEEMPEAEEPVEEIPEMPAEAPGDIGGAGSVDAAVQNLMSAMDEQIMMAVQSGDKEGVLAMMEKKEELARVMGTPMASNGVPGAEAMGPEGGMGEPGAGADGMSDEEIMALLDEILGPGEAPAEDETPAMKSASVTKGEVGGVATEVVPEADNGEQATPEITSGVAADQNTSDATSMATASASGDDGTISEAPVAKSSMEGSPDPNSMYSTDTDGLPLDSIVNLIHSRSGSGRFEIAKSGCEKTTTECGDVNAPLSNSSTEAVTNSNCEENVVAKSAEIEETGHAQEDLAANPQGEQTEILPDTAESNVAANPQPTKDDEATIAASDPVDGKHHTEDGKTEGDPQADADDNMDEAHTGPKKASALDMSISDMIIGRIGEGRGFMKSDISEGVEKSAKIEETSQPEEDLARKADTDPEEIESAGQAEAALSANPQPTKDDEETIESSSPVDGEHHDTEGVEKAEGAMTASSPGAVNPTFGGAGEELEPVAMAAPETAPKQASVPLQTRGKEIPSMRDMLASVHKSTFTVPASRPDVRCTANGEITHDPSQRRRTEEPSTFRIGHGIDPYEAVKSDWEEYRLYKARRTS